MRSCLAVIVLVIFASLNAIDGICCPDGCTHEREASSSPNAVPTKGDCVLCTGGLNRSAAEDLLPGDAVVSLVTGVATAAPDGVPPAPPEHPPRS